MIQLSKIWGLSLTGLACAAMFVATGAQAQITSYDVGPGGTVVPQGGLFPPIPGMGPVVAGDIQWSKNASATYNLLELTGSFYDTKVGVTYTTSSGSTGSYQQYVKALTPTTFTVDPAGKLSSGTFANELTWTGVALPNAGMSGGSLTLSKLHWNLLADGSAQVLATASGTNIGTTGDTVWWSTPASAVTNVGGLLTLSQLRLSSTALDLWAAALGLDFSELAYTALLATSGGMGSLRVGVVPEPATWLQMGLGLVGLGALLRRRSKG